MTGLAEDSLVELAACIRYIFEAFGPEGIVVDVRWALDRGSASVYSADYVLRSYGRMRRCKACFAGASKRAELGLV